MQYEQGLQVYVSAAKNSRTGRCDRYENIVKKGNDFS